MPQLVLHSSGSRQTLKLSTALCLTPMQHRHTQAVDGWPTRWPITNRWCPLINSMRVHVRQHNTARRNLVSFLTIVNPGVRGGLFSDSHHPHTALDMHAHAVDFPFPFFCFFFLLFLLLFLFLLFLFLFLFSLTKIVTAAQAFSSATFARPSAWVVVVAILWSSSCISCSWFPCLVSSVAILTRSSSMLSTGSAE